MRFVSAERNGEHFAALVDGDRLIPLRDVDELGALTDNALLAAPALKRSAAVPLAEARLRPVVPRPGKIICLGLNYSGHTAEASLERPEYPVLFTKFVESLIGPYDDVQLPAESSAPDYEVELAVIIGQRTRRATRDQALAAIAGVAVANDVTMRDYQRRTGQWLQGKSWEATTPLGPELVTLDEVDLEGGLDIGLSLNGVQMQRANTSALIFDVPTIIERVSEFVTLGPGDVILTGTPEGVGDFRDPPVRLQPGDLLRAEVIGVGVLENRVVSEAHDAR
jgi:acylpyruvate hydrolase